MKKLIPILLIAATVAAAESPIERWAAAMGGRAKLAEVRSIYREGTIETGGLTGTLKSWERSDGAYRDEVQIATFSNVETFDGATAMSQQGSAPPHKVAGADLERAFTRAFTNSQSMFFSDRRRGGVTVDGDDVTIKPEGGDALRITLDPQTALPKMLTRNQSGRTMTMTILSYETVDGVPLPKELRQSTGDPRFDVVIKFTKTVINPPVDAAFFTIAPKEDTASAVKWPEGKHSVTIPFELAQNHIYFPLSVNGKKPSSFVFDTGAEASVIEATHAKALALPTKGRVEGRGAGPGSVEVSLVENPVIAFGGLTLPIATLASLPLGNISLLEGREMQGIVGSDVLSRFITDIDYANRELRIYDPAAYTPNPRATALPFTFLGDIPIVKTKVTTRDGRTFEARLLVDTGARNAVVLNRPFIEMNDIARSIGASIEGPLGAGVGGATTQRVGRLKSIELAGFTIADPITSFSTDKSGGGNDDEIDGLIGGEILKRFTLTVDYPHERFLLEPNASLDDPFEYGMSGMLIAAGDTSFDRIVVRHVLAGSPADAAGIKVGDQLGSVDGQAVATMRLDAVRELFLKPGQTRALILRRDGKPVKVTITTKRLV